jgi:Cft2 family RNA processing exonuclease
MAWEIEHRDGIWLPQAGWWLDAKTGKERCFVSHAHSDHIARHRTVLCSAATARLMAARLGSSRREVLTLPFGEPQRLGFDLEATLHPAGHILGSSQLLLENEHGRLLFTGDFKLKPGLSCEPCATPRADVLIMETTFGWRNYSFPPAGETHGRIAEFCRETLAARKVPVLFAYSLGKSQEVLAGLRDTGLAIMLAPASFNMTRVCEELGASFPEYSLLDPLRCAGHVVIGPPAYGNDDWFRALPNCRTAVISGWAADAGAAYRFRANAAFPLSDHADHADLLAFVRAVNPTLVFTMHGFAREFASDLRALGIEAWALGLPNQLDLPLG